MSLTSRPTVEHVPHDSVEDVGSNPSTAPHLDDVVAHRYSRRSVLKGSTAAAAFAFFGGLQLAGAGTAVAGPRRPAPPGAAGSPLIGFTPVPPSAADLVTVPPEYTAQVLIPWGEQLFPGTSWRKDGSNSAAEAERLVGFNHDGIHYFPLAAGPGRNTRGLLVLNHEYTDASQIYSADEGSEITPDAAGLEKVRKALAGHGVTVVEVRQHGRAPWKHVIGSRFNRRITGSTPMVLSGPAISRTGTQGLGTLNNCGHGVTPWGTYLAAEENWNGYFGTEDPTIVLTATESRYGFVKAADKTVQSFGYRWHVADERFDLAKNRSEIDRFGWVVEIDPSAPTAPPVKRTALGRFKHEGVAVTESADGRVVGYSGDDENLEYVYKFVGSEPWREVRTAGRDPLDEGTLYVARFAEDGTGTWIPLVHGQGDLVTGFLDQADVLLRTREAADAVGATPLHRPEWIAVDERSNDVYLTLTNGSNYRKDPQQTDVGNPAVNSGRPSNPYGHVVRWRETGGDNAATTFAWEIFVLAGDPKYDSKVTLDEDDVFGSPDGIWVDPDSRIWIQTDVSNSSQNLASRFYDRIANNQMLVADPVTREIKRFLTGPRGCEVTGVITTPDQRTMFVNIQHPGESTTYWNDLAGGGPTVEEPGRVSNWPTPRRGGESVKPTVRPRPATVVIRRKDGGVIGS